MKVKLYFVIENYQEMSKAMDFDDQFKSACYEYKTKMYGTSYFGPWKV
ncbi:hypothetical protein [Clostridioides difficile]